MSGQIETAQTVLLYNVIYYLGNRSCSILSQKRNKNYLNTSVKRNGYIIALRIPFYALVNI